ncbi:MAG: alpha/beta fold hydrolase [Eubacteriales bacterium]|nr:alpha/beta fold hydrolase [Eubacteriales bacterium]
MEYKFPSSCGILIPGKRGTLLAQHYLPGGEYPKPAVIICHGIPGNEKLLDLAIYLREHGFCTVTFHYSGSWGSEGDYSVRNCFEDTETVIEYLQRNEEGWFDTENIFVIGHSLGGLIASYATSSFQAVKGGVILAPFNLKAASEPIVTGKGESFLNDLFVGGKDAAWLRNFRREVFVSELLAEPEKYDLNTYVKPLSEKPTFLITCLNDETCEKSVHGDRLAGEIRKHGSTDTFLYKEYETDHCFNTMRNELKQDISDFLLRSL